MLAAYPNQPLSTFHFLSLAICAYFTLQNEIIIKIKVVVTMVHNHNSWEEKNNPKFFGRHLLGDVQRVMVNWWCDGNGDHF